MAAPPARLLPRVRGLVAPYVTVTRGDFLQVLVPDTVERDAMPVTLPRDVLSKAYHYVNTDAPAPVPILCYMLEVEARWRVEQRAVAGVVQTFRLAEAESVIAEERLESGRVAEQIRSLDPSARYIQYERLVEPGPAYLRSVMHLARKVWVHPLRRYLLPALVEVAENGGSGSDGEPCSAMLLSLAEVYGYAKEMPHVIRGVFFMPRFQLPIVHVVLEREEELREALSYNRYWSGVDAFRQDATRIVYDEGLEI